jgi:hypothetical protein
MRPTSTDSATVGRWPLPAVLLAALCSLAALMPAVASAGPVGTYGPPKPGFTESYSDYANCPAKFAANYPALCLHSYTSGGYVQIGHSITQISIPGNTLDWAFEPEGNHNVMAPIDDIIGGPAQPVPGGLLGVVGNHRLTGVTARLEWAEALPTNALFGKTEGCGGTDPYVTFSLCRFLSGSSGTAITLSVKVHLSSPFLGPSCFIGSATEPILLPLTTGRTNPPPPNTPIQGDTGTFRASQTGLRLVNIKLVNNSFPVPTAHGCGTSGGDLVDEAINQKLGLPSPAGRNTVVLNTTGESLNGYLALENGWTGDFTQPGSEEAGPPAPSPTPTGAAQAGLPDGRAYELVSPVAKNGVGLYGAVPSPDGKAVDYQARGAFGGSETGSLNLYQATRTSGGWQSASLTPEPSDQLAFLELQAPMWTSGDLSQTIFATPASYDPGDQDEGALSLYARDSAGNLTWLSRGTQGGADPKHATFDAATPDGNDVLFSSSASLLPAATELSPEAAPEAEHLYRRDVAAGQTSLVSVDNGGHPAGYAATTLPNGYQPGSGGLAVASTAGFYPKQVITVGTGESAVTTTVSQVQGEDGIVVGNGSGLSVAFPPGTTVTHLSEGSVLGDGAALASGPPPAFEYLPANASSGATTNAISSDGSKVFFEAPAPFRNQPVSLYMRQDDSTTTKIAGGALDGGSVTGFFAEANPTFGSARFKGAAADGSLVFFSSDEGLAGATEGEELYEFNTTNQAIGPAAPMSVSPISTGLGGDQDPATTLTEALGVYYYRTLHVASTAGFSPGETVRFGPFHTAQGGLVTNMGGVIASVVSATELTLTAPLFTLIGGLPAGTELHGVHEASMVAIANDGSHVYFVSDGVFANNTNSQGVTATAVEPNLYRFDTASGETTFLATLAKSDVEEANGNPAGLVDGLDIDRPAIPTPDGSVLVFASAANLTGQNPWEEFTEIYRYSVAGETLECLSCTAPGVAPVGDADFGETAGGTYAPPGLSSPITEDGSMVFFDTPDSLVSSDRNGASPLSAKFGQPTSTDVYEWRGGEVFMLSAGTASAPSVLQGTNPSGNDVLFTSTSQLVPFQADGGYENVFDARVGGGFPAAEEEAAGAPSCVGSGCRGAFGEEPAFTAPASLGSQGDGNLTPAKKHKKRHAKKRQQKNHKHKKAGRGRASQR